MISMQTVRLTAAPLPLPIPRKKKLDLSSLPTVRIPDFRGSISVFETISDGVNQIKKLLGEGEIGKLTTAYDTESAENTTNTFLIRTDNGKIVQITIRDEFVSSLNESLSDDKNFLMVNSKGVLVLVTAGFFEENICAEIMRGKTSFPVYQPN